MVKLQRRRARCITTQHASATGLADQLPLDPAAPFTDAFLAAEQAPVVTPALQAKAGQPVTATLALDDHWIKRRIAAAPSAGALDVPLS
jgi:hypothetical protein